MPEKSKAPKKKAAKPTAPHARNSKTAYYVAGAECSVLVSDQKPKDGRAVKSYSGFDEARSAAIDTLLAAIEKAEKHLLALKRAKHFNDLTKTR